jgi:hypothetical protein
MFGRKDATPLRRLDISRVLADHLRGDERVGAGAEVEHPFAGREPTELPRVCDPANEPTALSGTFASSSG